MKAAKRINFEEAEELRGKIKDAINYYKNTSTFCYYAGKDLGDHGKIRRLVIDTVIRKRTPKCMSIKNAKILLSLIDGHNNHQLRKMT